jgi:prolyl-tRNA synthetase
MLRGREFLMKDLYSFARDQQQHEEVYEEIAAAYHKVYERLGIGDSTYRVKADGGIFTKRFSDEFQTRSPIGEDTIFHAPHSDIYFNQEVAPSKAPLQEQPEEQLPMEEKLTPGVVGVEQLAATLGVPVDRTVKTMLYVIDDKVTAVAVRGDYIVNEIKLRMALDAKSVTLADEATVVQVTGAEIGYAGLIGLPNDVQIVADDSIEPLVNFELGANKTNYHNVNVNWGRDVPKPARFYDVTEAKKGDVHPESGMTYEVFKAVEVGNIFPLESKYTDLLDMYYTDEEGKRQSLIMGCYGIGISRLMGVIAEHFADDKGLVWPKNIAPYTVYLVAIGKKGTAQADSIYDRLQKQGVEVLYDDRDARPGEKFADAELLGIPYRVTCSDRLGEMVECTERQSGEMNVLTPDELLAKLS